jgi:hypothetical protein
MQYVSPQEVRALPRLASVAFAARLARCVYPFYLLHSERDWFSREDVAEARALRDKIQALGDVDALAPLVPGLSLLKAYERSRRCPDPVEAAIAVAEQIAQEGSAVRGMETTYKEAWEEVAFRESRAKGNDPDKRPWFYVSLAGAQAAAYAIKAAYGGAAHPAVLNAGRDPTDFAADACIMALMTAQIATDMGGQFTRYHFPEQNLATPLIRRDYQRLLEAAISGGWTDETRVPPNFFGVPWAHEVVPDVWGLVLAQYSSTRAAAEEAEAQLELAQPILGDMQAGGRVRFDRAADLTAEVVSGIDRAPALQTRHNGLIQSDDIVRAIILLRQAGDRSRLQGIRGELSQYGGFLLRYELDELVRRLSDPLWVVTEAVGRQMYRDRPRHGELIRAADCQCQLPRDVEGAAPVIHLPEPDEGDKEELGSEIARRIRACPAIAGCVEDLCAERDAAQLGFAGEARNRAFEVIRRLPRRFPIRYMAAELFSIKGLRLPDGSDVSLAGFDPPLPELRNTASYIAHECSRRYPAFLGWILKEREVPVTLEVSGTQAQYRLITDWWVMIHDLTLAGG